MRRYDIDMDEPGDARMIEDSLGEYCLWMDVEEEIEDLKKENAKLRELANYGGEVASKNTDTMLRQSGTIEKQQEEIEALKEDRNEVIRKVERMREWMQSRAAPPNIKDDTGKRVDVWEWYLKLNDEDA